MSDVIEKAVRVNRGAAQPVAGDSMQAVVDALGEGVGRVEVSEAEWVAADLARNERKAQRFHERNDAAAAAAQRQELDRTRGTGL